MKIYTGEGKGIEGEKMRIIKIGITIFALLFIILIIIFSLWNRTTYEEQWLWSGGEEYQYRIPGVIYTKNGTVVTYCEQRESLDDWSAINIVAKVSEDSGQNWSEDIVIVNGISEGKTVNNPVMIADGSRIHLLYDVEYGLEEKNGGVYYCYSEDEGYTWSKSVPILLDRADYNVFAMGPGHGILTSKGRLIVPVWMVRKDAGSERESHHPGSVSTIYSDDHGATWKMGEEIPTGLVTDPNESTIVELSDGTFLMNIRNQVDYEYEYSKDENGSVNQKEVEEWNNKKYRAISYSNTGIDGWSAMQYDEDLPDPVCFGSLCSYDEDCILFVNCDSQKAREYLTIRVSEDNGKTWEKKATITEKGGYADLIVDKDGNILCFAEYSYSSNKDTDYSIKMYKFNMNWIERR